MKVGFGSADLERLANDPGFSGGFPGAIVTAFRKRVQQLEAAADERDLYASRGLRLEKLKGKREGQHSIRLNDQMRLVIEFQGKGNAKVVMLLELLDYH